MSQPIVFFDIAGPEETDLRDFYEKVFNWPCGSPGPFSPGNAKSIGANIRSDPKETLLYVGVEDVTATLGAIEAAGGRIDVPRFEVSGVAVLGLFEDPAGNRMGLIEMAGEAPKIP
ncbi:MAG: hypothetical protein AAGK23_13595 [Pseudomonadota bacterium]